jgi:hypothetical protein
MSDITPDMVLQDLQTQMDNYAKTWLKGDVHDADRLITKAANVLRWFEERAIIVSYKNLQVFKKEGRWQVKVDIVWPAKVDYVDIDLVLGT